MANPIVLKIREILSIPSTDGKINVSLEYGLFGYHCGSKTVNICPTQSFVRSLTLPHPDEEVAIAWFLEKYVREPLATTRAQHARAYIRKQALALYDELQIDEKIFLTNGSSHVILEVMSDGNISRLHWEALDGVTMQEKNLNFRVCRVSTRERNTGLIQRAPTQGNDQLTVNILLVVARKKADIDHRLTAQPLLRMLRNFGLNRIVVDIARPGTKETFLEHLSRKDYHIVHFDMHGEVESERAYLLFKHPSKESTIRVSADEIGQSLFKHRVKLVVMNACKSASTSGRADQTNLAAQLARHGVEFVVGMAYEVSEIAIKKFHEAFYDSILRKGEDILCAVQHCREALENDKIRKAQIFHLAVQLDDYLVPAVYTSRSHMERSEPFILNQIAKEDTTTTTLHDTLSLACDKKLPDDFLGRGCDMLKIENHLVQDGICLVQGFRGCGKWSLLAHLAQWLKDSGLVNHVFVLDCTSVRQSADAYEELYRQLPPGSIAQRLSLEDRQVTHQQALVQYVAFSRCMVILRDVDDQLDWVARFIHDLAFATRDEEDKVSNLLVAISSAESMIWLRSDLKTHIKVNPPLVTLSGLEGTDATDLAANVLERSPKAESVGAQDRTASWYTERILELLQFHPLAIEMAFPKVAQTDPSAVYWSLQTSDLFLDWRSNDAGLRLLRSWEPLLHDLRPALKVLLPFQESVTGYLLEELFMSTSKQQDDILPSTVQALEACGAVTVVTEPSDTRISHLTFHPLFCQFIRSQTWTDEEIRSSWHNLSVYYHNLSLKWIQDGMYTKRVTIKLAREWQNIVRALGKLLPELGKDSEESALFDLVWIVCSFQVSYKGMPKFALDIFADITVAALRQVVPEFAVSSNYAWQVLIKVELRFTAKRLSKFQLIRAILYCQFMIQYFYDVSLDTAQAYQANLHFLLESVHEDGSDEDFSKLLEIARCVDRLTAAEFATEEGYYFAKKPILQEDDALARLSPDLKDFARLWSEVQVHRALGFRPDYTHTWTNLTQSLRTVLPESERNSRMEPFLTLADAFEALNGGESGLLHGRARLEDRLSAAIDNGDSRRQLDLYDKLVEVYTMTRDWEAVLLILNQIDKCKDDVQRLAGFKVNEVEHLQRQRWMITRRAQCLKRLGRSSESKKQISELRRIVKRREELWTEEDRAKEQARNFGAYIERGMADATKKEPTTLEYLSGGHSFMRQKYYTDDELDCQPQSHVENETCDAQTPGDVASTLPAAGSVVGDISSNENVGECAISRQSEDVDRSLQSVDSPRNPSSYAPNDGVKEQLDELDFSSDESSADSDHEGDDADDLYLILNPWMKGITKLMDSLVKDGARRVSTYAEFQMPPGHSGGLFLIESRHFMIKAVLDSLEVSN